MLNLFKTAGVRAWIAGLVRLPAAPTGKGEPGVLVTVSRFNPALDAIGELPVVSCWRLRNEDCRHYQHRLAIHLQQLINEREDLEALLDRVITCDSR